MTRRSKAAPGPTKLQAAKNFKSVLIRLKSPLPVKLKGFPPHQVGYDDFEVIQAWTVLEQAIHGPAGNENPGIGNIAYDIWLDVLTLRELSKLPYILRRVDGLIQDLGGRVQVRTSPVPRFSCKGMKCPRCKKIGNVGVQGTKDKEAGKRRFICKNDQDHNGCGHSWLPK